MPSALANKKSLFACRILSAINSMALRARFQRLEVSGRENLPESAPFLLVSNHVSRWDGPVLNELIRRPANWMVSPNELKGIQGALLKSMGAFPANPRYDIVAYARDRLACSEPVVIFPEGDIKLDGATHPFKQGAARIALSAWAAGIQTRVLPAALFYQRTEDRGDIARILLGEPVDIEPFLALCRRQSNIGVRELSCRLHREVSHLRAALGSEGDRLALYRDLPQKSWSSGARIGRQEGENEETGAIAGLDSRSHAVGPARL